MIAKLGYGTCQLDTDLRYVSINVWLAKLNGVSVEDHIGRTIGEILPHVAAGVETVLRGVMETGQPVINGIVEAETPAFPNEKRRFQHDYHVRTSSDGEVIGVKCIVQDVTEIPELKEA